MLYHLLFLRDFQKYDSLITKQLKKPELWFCTELHAPTIFFPEGFLNQQRKTKLKIQIVVMELFFSCMLIGSGSTFRELSAVGQNQDHWYNHQ